MSYFSAKLKCFACKIESAESPTRLVTNFPSYFNALVSDLTVFRESIDVHKMFLKKEANRN